MSIDFLTNAQRIQTTPTDGGGVPGALITAHASANTKGSYADLIASTSFDASWLLLQCTPAGAAFDCLIDVAIGAAASEQIIVANIVCSSSAKETCPSVMLLPIPIKAGTRISARCQATTGGNVARCSATVIAGAHIAPLGVAVTYGANTADSGGVSVDPGGSAGTKGAYSEITSATTREISWVCVCIGNQNNTARTAYWWGVDIAIGGAGTEQVVIPDILLGAHNVNDNMLPQAICVPCHIPAGSRIAARAVCNGTDATDRLLDVAVIGVG